MINWKDLCEIKTQNKSMFSNGGWAYDAYPELETLDAYSSITIAEIKGPAVITCFHTTQHILHKNPGKRETPAMRTAEAARGVILEIYYNDNPVPAVKVPLGDFFADGCCGQAKDFASKFIEKAPRSYNCFIPMPFEKSARVILKNETENDYMNYSFIEYEQLPAWDKSLGYFHATWSRFGFQLTEKTNLPFLHIDGTGHLLGRAWSVCTDEPLFDDFHFVMEANNEFRIDNETKPRLDYLGTEDSFAFSWGFQKEYSGPYNGMNYIKNDSVTNYKLLSIYRFMESNVIRFNKSLDLKVNWSKEEHFFRQREFIEAMEAMKKRNGGWIDYATTNYWYQKEVGFNHSPMLPLEERCKTLLKTNSL